MSGSLFDPAGQRKYLTARERSAVVRAALGQGGEVGAFCLTLAFTGARISEALALTAARIDSAGETIVFETLKRRGKRVYRAVPVPHTLIVLLNLHDTGKEGRLWSWGRTTGWKCVKKRLFGESSG